MAKRTGSGSSANKRHASNNSNSSSSPNGNVFTTSGSRNSANVRARRISKAQERKERDAIVLWRCPLTTLRYFLQELLVNLRIYGLKLWSYKKFVALLVSLVVLTLGMCSVEGPHQPFVEHMRKKMWWCLYWIGLGILSSVGLGTGLHTFLLYLGPHIASVTTAAYICKSLKFPEPPYPDEIVCPDEPEDATNITIFKIMSKVQLEAVMWGIGTALGELPPYFMAKASRLSGHDPDDDDIAEFEQLLQQRRARTQEMSALDRAKLVVENLVERLGFFGILACASIPNPLFDLAGITCGHFLVPFWTFFGATLLGKAIIKMHIQKLFVIIAFNEVHVETVVSMIKYIPYIGKDLHTPFKDFLVKQKAKLRRRPGMPLPQEESWLAWVFEKFVAAMIVYFVLSIVNSMARSYHKRLCKRRRENSISKYNKVSAD